MKNLLSSQYIIVRLLMLVLFISITSCAAIPSTDSGFLEDYSQLQEDKNGDKSLKWWEKNDFDWGKYKSLMLDPVVVLYHPQTKDKKISAYKENELATYFHSTVSTELEGKYQVVSTPGPEVLRIRAAITEITPSSPAINYPAMLLVFFPVDMGGATIEVEFLDSETNEVLATMVDKKRGSPFTPRAFSRLGHTRAAFDGWAKELRKALDTHP
ncbi:DUF3313 domain-containing protein [Flagellimonas nanhaiensis]|uniref:DUF3313 domain-containing protein n=1 Tax=Flagellimonas nanhaiensis TaxID=2292706 RepID=A0A371JT96_9FLAO|nr:DUF3313 domain-containing protein [Allomuricauda nanhaiensis]RDY61042.1 DUF3313 domain-containing protein [Allomuricauda nanhaiensis]